MKNFLNFKENLSKFSIIEGVVINSNVRPNMASDITICSNGVNTTYPIHRSSLMRFAKRIYGKMKADYRFMIPVDSYALVYDSRIVLGVFHKAVDNYLYENWSTLIDQVTASNEDFYFNSVDIFSECKLSEKISDKNSLKIFKNEWKVIPFMDLNYTQDTALTPRTNTGLSVVDDWDIVLLNTAPIWVTGIKAPKDIEDYSSREDESTLFLDFLNERSGVVANFGVYLAHRFCRTDLDQAFVDHKKVSSFLKLTSLCYELKVVTLFNLSEVERNMVFIAPSFIDVLQWILGVYYTHAFNPNLSALYQLERQHIVQAAIVELFGAGRKPLTIQDIDRFLRSKDD